MVQTPLISVVIATYNGSKYLADQLNSIFNQTYKNIEVIVCDDRSTDSTVEILKEYQSRFNLQYFINNTKQGVIKNFETGISLAQGDYVALSDQDDVWVPQKLERSLSQLIQLEEKTMPGTPALIFTDLTVVDENLTPLSSSYWDFMQLNPDNTQLNRILVENVMTGCTLLMNRATIDLALPIPKEALMHDVWFLMVVSCFGQVTYLPEKTVLYRQHCNNVVGARQVNLFQKLSNGLAKIRQNRFSLLEPEIQQAASFYKKYQKELLAEQHKKATLEAFISLKNSNYFKKKYLIVKHAFYGSTVKKALNVLIRA